MLRILRGLDSRALPCGCLVGVYETYAAETVAIIDAKGIRCAERKHRVDSAVELQMGGRTLNNYPPSTIPTSNR